MERLPVVHKTGGLADTVIDANPQTLKDRTANGFSFEHFDAGGLRYALQQALMIYGDKSVWQQLVENGMRHDWSWASSAAAYEKLYQQTASAGRRPLQPA